MKYIFLLISLIYSLQAAELPSELSKVTSFIQVALSDVPPISYMENDELKGINVEIWKKLQLESGLRFNYTLYPHSRITNLLDEENPDLIIVFAIICHKYSDKYEIQKTKLYSLNPSILLKKSVDPKKIDIRIGRVIGTCNKLAKKYVKHDLDFEVVNMDQAFKMLESDRLDGICGNEQVIDYNLKNHLHLKNQLVEYQTQNDGTDSFDAVICRKKNLDLAIKIKLERAASQLIIPKLKSY